MAIFIYHRRKTVFMNLIKEILLKDFTADCDIITNMEAIKLRKDRKVFFYKFSIFEGTNFFGFAEK